MLNKSIQVSQQGSVIEGIVKGLSPEGGLVLSSGGRETTLFAGDVTILQPDAHTAHPAPHAPGN
jgi:biotin-(acetyl-CoA carboxylase) ligase